MGPDVDVITIAEAWCKRSGRLDLTNGIVCLRITMSLATFCRQAFRRQLGWKHSSDILWHPGKGSKVVSGGVIVFSKWPLKAHNQYSLRGTVREGQRRIATRRKGAQYVKIIKTDPVTKVKQAFNIFGTHLQAWSTEAGKTARAGQLHELRDTYLPALRIPETGSEVVIFQGDMNTDFVLHPEEVATMKSALHAELPTWVGDQPFSSDPSTNFLVGKDGAAKTNGCETAYRAQSQYWACRSGRTAGRVHERPYPHCLKPGLQPAVSGPEWSPQRRCQLQGLLSVLPPRVTGLHPLQL